MSTQNAMIEVQTEFLKTRIALLSRQPFYAEFLARCTVSFTNKVQTACAGVLANGQMVMAISPEFFMSLTPHARVGLVIHEMLHIMMRHTERHMGVLENKPLANIATDMAINQYIEPEYLPEGALLPSKENLPPWKSSDFYYEELLKRQPPGQPEPDPNGDDEEATEPTDEDPINPGDGGDGDEGEEEDDSGSGSTEDGESEEDSEESEEGGTVAGTVEGGVAASPTFDDHDADLSSIFNEEEASQELAEVVAGSALDKAYEVAGSKPGSLSQKVEQVVKLNQESRLKELSWEEELKRYVGEAVGRAIESSRTKANRRLGLAAPGSKPSVGPRVIVALDNSGSVNGELFGRLIEEVKEIMTGQDDGVEVVHFDTKILKVEHLRQVGDKVTRHGDGGTNFDVPLEYARQEGADLVIMLTDGEAPVTRRPSTEVIWALPSVEHEKLYGKNLGKHGRVLVIQGGA